ncbi:hypothetical protein Tco_0019674, partial [Tanacetum coccineum]
GFTLSLSNFDLLSFSRVTVSSPLGQNLFAGSEVLERIIKKRTKNEAKSTKPDSEWKSKEKTKSKSKPKPEKSTQVNPDKSKSQHVKKYKFKG